MSSELQTKTTLTRVKEAQMALAKAQVAMDSIQSGLGAVETVAEKAESARRHPLRTSIFALLGATILFGVIVALRNMSD